MPTDDDILKAVRAFRASRQAFNEVAAQWEAARVEEDRLDNLLCKLRGEMNDAQRAFLDILDQSTPPQKSRGREFI